MRKTDDKTAMQLTVVGIVGIIGIILAYRGDTSYIPILTAIMGLLVPSPVDKIVSSGENKGN